MRGKYLRVVLLEDGETILNWFCNKSMTQPSSYHIFISVSDQKNETNSVVISITNE